MFSTQFIKGITIDWSKTEPGSYLHSIAAICGIDSIEFRSPVTFFAGENGTGKSTLLEAIAVAYGFNPEGGTRNYSFSTYDSHSDLCHAVRLSRGVRKPSWGYFLRAESFLALAQKNFRPNGLYFLDEPEAALSPQRQLTLLAEIHRCARGGAQFFIVTHSPILLGLPDAEILSFDGGPIHPCPYEETDSFRITSMFINHREMMLHQLLES